VQSPPTRARASEPAANAERPTSAYARSLLDCLDDLDEQERKLMDEAAELDRTQGEPKPDEP
jgi:hypothetical protein